MIPTVTFATGLFSELGRRLKKTHQRFAGAKPASSTLSDRRACYNRPVSFDWMNAQTPDRARGAKQRRAMYRAELSERAAMLARLNYSQAQACARLCANVDWDFEVGTGGRPAGITDDEVERIVKASYARR